MKTINAILFGALLGLVSFSANVNAAFPFDGRSTTIAEVKTVVASMNQGVLEFDKVKIQNAREELMKALDKDSDSDELKYLIAKSYELEANIIRHYDREDPEMERDEKKAFRAEQKRLAEEGLPYIESMSEKYRENADVLTVEGVLYTHKISGMFSGIANGPKAKRRLKKALKKEPDNPRVLAAYGRMYLYNPPFAGGNLDKAEATYKKVIEFDPKLMQAYTLLARTYNKQGKPTQAELYLKKALQLNPENKEAALLLANYEAS